MNIRAKDHLKTHQKIGRGPLKHGLTALGTGDMQSSAVQNKQSDLSAT